jgi:hypothetical protein
MESAALTDARVRELVAGIGGARVAEAKLGIGSFVTLTMEPAQGAGEWYLWVYQCAWRLERNGLVVAGSEDDRDVLRDAIDRLAFARVAELELAPPADATLWFDGGACLRMFCVFSTPTEQWMLWRPDGRVLTARPDGWRDEPREVPAPE